MTHAQERDHKALELARRFGISTDTKPREIRRALNRLGYYWFPGLRLWKRKGE